eukprot:5398740-Pleurochrysis_carterae.AAC.1
MLTDSDKLHEKGEGVSSRGMCKDSLKLFCLGGQVRHAVPLPVCSEFSCGGDESGKTFRPEIAIALWTICGGRCWRELLLGDQKDLFKNVPEIKEFGRVVEFEKNGLLTQKVAVWGVCRVACGLGL